MSASPERTAAKTRIGVLISGRGSNLFALQEACARGDVPAEIVVVISNQQDAAGVAKAREQGIPVFVLEHRGLRRADHEQAILLELRRHGVEWVCLAGYLRILGRDLVEAYPERILNIHPSLLPAFPGLDAQRQAWEYGVKIAGCTVHLVDHGLDSGPIVAQSSFVVPEGIGSQELADHVLRLEHQLYPATMRRLLTENWAVEGRRLVFG